MRIAFLTQYFDPEPAIKLTALVQRLVTEGHEVEVLTSLPNLPRGRLYEGYRLTSLMHDDRLGATVLRTFVWPYRGRVIWKRIMHLASFALSACIYCWRLREFDLLYVYHPPLTISIPAMLLSVKRRKPMLYDVQDLWPQAGLAAGAIRHGMLYRLINKWAKFIYKKADHITVIAPEFKATLVAAGVPAEKITVIPNWTDECCFEPKPPADSRGRFGIPEEVFVVMYAGNFGSSHGVGTILEAAGLLQDRDDIFFVFSGSGAEYNQCIKWADNAMLPNVRFLGYLEQRSDLPWLYACADIMLVHLRRSPSGAVSVPSRLLAYMACARPVLACCEGAPLNLVQAAGCGIACEPENPSTLAAAIACASEDRSSLREMGAKGRLYYNQTLSARQTTERLMFLIRSLSHAPSAQQPASAQPFRCKPCGPQNPLEPGIPVLANRAASTAPSASATILPQHAKK